MEGWPKQQSDKRAEQMTTSSRDLARSRHEHDFALLECLSGSWRSRSGLGWSSSGSRGRRTRASFCQSHSDHRSQYRRAVLHHLSEAPCVLHFKPQHDFLYACTSDVFECRPRLRKSVQNTHMVAERWEVSTAASARVAELRTASWVAALKTRKSESAAHFESRR